MHIPKRYEDCTTDEQRDAWILRETRFDMAVMVVVILAAIVYFLGD